MDVGKKLEQIKYEDRVGCVHKKREEERWYVVSMLVNRYISQSSIQSYSPLPIYPHISHNVSLKLQETQSCKVQALSVNHEIPRSSSSSETEHR